MKAFLQQVAAHYFARPDILQTCFVFPNRRSLVFFRKYLGELVKGGKPIPAPPLFTISDFFCQVSGKGVTDSLSLLLELYQCYLKLNPAAEPLDEFVFWGEVLLGDFDDIDKYLVNAESLFSNVADFKAIQDNFSYLSATQREAIEHFLSHFRDARGGLSVNPEGTDVKARFLRLWNLLYPLYRDFRAVLQDKDMAYEGMVYRELASQLREGASVADILREAFPGTDGFVFVGLNALNECERTVLKKMRDAGLAQFVWDFVSEQIQDPANKASLYMRGNLADFPQAFPLETEGIRPPSIQVISVPSAVGQAKLAPQILAQCKGEPVETAFILPDENQLLPLLSSIPPESSSINVTMGYPMSGSAVFTLMQALGQLQLRLRQRPEGWYFYYRPLREVLSSGLLRNLLTPQEEEVVSRVKAEAKYYIPVADLRQGPLLSLIFQPVVQAPSEASAAQNHAIEDYLSQIIGYVGRALTAGGDMLLELDFAKRCHTALNILHAKDLELLPATYFRLLERMLQGISVPFRGEPLEGLQIMGPLETRALDFRNVIILNANEGVFPRRSFNASFIPPELRKGFGLPTYEYQDSVWAYYFYRLIQRAEKLWLLYDSRTEGLKSGEESRYIKQLEYHFGLPLQRFTAAAPLHPVQSETDIPKTPADIQALREGHLSASVLQSYLFCQAKFYYQAVKRLEMPDQVEESLNAGMLGNAFHAVMQELYSAKPSFSKADIQGMAADEALLRRLVRAAVLKEMHSIEVTGRNLVLEEVILDYVKRTLRHDAALLPAGEQLRILGLERFMETRFQGFRFLGYVDRIDSYRKGEVRIVDYKTGKVQEEDLMISDDNAAAVVDKLFGPNNQARPKIALQLFLYGLFAHDAKDLAGMKLVNAIYSTSWLYTRDLPEVRESAEFTRMMKERLTQLLQEITDPAVPFSRTSDLKTCEHCDFRSICGR